MTNLFNILNQAYLNYTENKRKQHKTIRKWLTQFREIKKPTKGSMLSKVHIFGNDKKYFPTKNRSREAILFFTYTHNDFGIKLNELLRYFSYEETNLKPIKKRRMLFLLNELEKKGWLIQAGHYYYLNPILSKLTKWGFKLFHLANLKLDFFKILDYQMKILIEKAEKEGIADLKVEFAKTNVNMIQKFVFNQYALIVADLKNGEKVEAVFPINLHRAGRFQIPHFCIPLSPYHFGIKDIFYYSFDGEDGRLFVHFDNSMTVNWQKYYQDYLTWKKPLEKTLKKWSNKQHFYLEINNLNTFKKLITLRLKGLKGYNLFETLKHELQPQFN